MGSADGLKQRLWAVWSGSAAADDFRTRHPSGHGGILVAWVCGFIFTTLFGCRNVNLD